MLKNISLGLYYPGKSVLHRLQARTKLLIVGWIFISLLVANRRMWHFAPYIFLFLLFVLGAGLAGIMPRAIWRRLWFLVAITITSALFAIFSSQGDPTVLYKIGPLLSSYGLARTVLLVCSIVLIVAFLFAWLPVVGQYWIGHWLKRLRALIGIMLLLALLAYWFVSGFSAALPLTIGPLIVTHGSAWVLMTSLGVLVILYVFSLLLTMTTQPVALIEGLTILLSPLRRFKLPVDDFALMTLLALRFIPTLFDEAEQLIKAQTSRGADVMHGTVRERIQSLTMFFVPLMQGTLRRAADLSVALEARGYQVEGKQTLLHETTFGLIDYAAIGVVVLVTVGALML